MKRAVGLNRLPQREHALRALYLSSDSRDVHDQNETVPLTQLPHDQTCPGNAALQKLQQQFR